MVGKLIIATHLTTQHANLTFAKFEQHSSLESTIINDHLKSSAKIALSFSLTISNRPTEFHNKELI